MSGILNPAGGMFPTMIGKWILVVDQRGESYADMSADEYASRVLQMDTPEGVANVKRADMIALVSADMDTATVIKPIMENSMVKLEVVQAIGHEEIDGPPVVRLDDVVDFIRSLPSYEEETGEPLLADDIAERLIQHFDPSE